MSKKQHNVIGFSLLCRLGTTIKYLNFIIIEVGKVIKLCNSNLGVLLNSHLTLVVIYHLEEFSNAVHCTLFSAVTGWNALPTVQSAQWPLLSFFQDQRNQQNIVSLQCAIKAYYN